MDTLTSSATFSSWNDYLGLATLITKAEKGFDVSDPGSGPRGYGLMLQGCSSTDWQPMMEPLVYPKSIPEQRVCVFCRNNKETAMLYSTHTLKGADGRVQCPVLRRYTCPLCGASGDQAHTIKYCPLSRARDKAQSFQDSLCPQVRADGSLKSNLACCSPPQPQKEAQIAKPIILLGHLMGPEASVNQHPKYCPPSHSGARGRMARLAMGRIIR